MKKILIPLCMIITLSSCQMLNKYRKYDNKDDYHALFSAGETYNETLKNIDVDWVSGNINVSISDEYEGITIIENSPDNNDEYKAHIYRDGNNLEIKYMKSNKIYKADFEKDLYIYVPTNYQIDDFEINSVSSKIVIDKIIVNNLEIENVSGKTTLDLQNTNKFSGNFVSSPLSAIISTTITDLDIESVSGNVILSLNDKVEGFNLEFETTLGKMSSDFELLKNNDKYYYNNSASSSWKIETASSNLSIIKYQKEEN